MARAGFQTHLKPPFPSLISSLIVFIIFITHLENLTIEGAIMQGRGGGRGRRLLLLSVVLSSLQACGGGGGLDDTQGSTEQYALAISPDGRTVASGGTYVVTTYGGYSAGGVGGATGESTPAPSDPSPGSDPGPVENIPPDDTPGDNSGVSGDSGSTSGDSNAPPDESNAGEGDLSRKGHQRLGRRAFARIARAEQTAQKRGNGSTGRAASRRLYPVPHPVTSTPVTVGTAATLTARGQATPSVNNGRYITENLNGRVWFASADTGQYLRTASLGQIVYALAYSPDGTMLASGSQDQVLRLLDAQTGGILQEFRGHGDRISGVAFSPDGKRLASAGYNDHTVRLWDVATGTLQAALSTGKEGATCVAFSPDGKTVAGGEGNGTVLVWDAQTGSVLHTLTAHQFAVWAVAFSPDGNSLASGSADNKTDVWDTQTGSLRLTLLGHTNFVFSVRFAPDGQTLATGSADRTVKIWNAQTGALLNTFSAPTAVQAVDYTPDSQFVVAAGVAGSIQAWNVASGQIKWQQQVH
jgi:WD40 repeat protein